MINTTGDPNKNIIPVFDSGDQDKGVQLVAAPQVVITDLSDADTHRFQIGTSVYIPLTTNLTLVAKAAGVIKSNPILKGTTIDRVELTFAYNKTIASQTLTNNGGEAVPTLSSLDTGYTYTGRTIQSNIAFTLTGNDGSGEPGGIAADVENITFGNLMWLGFGVSKIGAAASGMEAFIEALQASVTKTARAHTYFATGGVNEKHFVAYPKAWGEGIFTKGIFSGGYIRLRNVAGTMQTSGSETDLIITNSLGIAEAYYVYESLYDNQNDGITPFVIS